MNPYENPRRLQRINGHPGVWATRLADGWTIYTVKGIYKRGIQTEAKVRRILGQVKMVVKNGEGSEK